MDDIEKAIQRVLNFETTNYNSFFSAQAKNSFENALEEVKPILLKNQETKDEALNIAYTIYTKRYLGINVIAFLLKEKANPNIIIDNKPIIDLFILEEDILKLFISAGFDVNSKVFSNDNTSLITYYHLKILLNLHQIQH